MVDFNKLKSSKGSSLSKLTEKLEAMNSGSSKEKDSRIYKPGFDKKEGTGYAIVRFIPAQEGEPWVKKISHSFQGPGGWYIENNRVSAGHDDDPVSISNKLHWDKGEAEKNDAIKNVAKKRKRKNEFFAWVYVVKDKVNPQFEGQTMIYDFGPQIFGFIEKAIKPEFEDEVAFDPFDMWTGRDFKIKMTGKTIPDSRDPSKQVVVPNYESCGWSDKSELFEGDDAKKEEVYLKTSNLDEFIKVKSFEELAARFLKVTGEAHDALQAGDPADKAVKKLEEQIKEQEQKVEEPKQEKVKEAKAAPVVDDQPSEDEDDVLAMFQKLAGGDDD